MKKIMMSFTALLIGISSTGHADPDAPLSKKELERRFQKVESERKRKRTTEMLLGRQRVLRQRAIGTTGSDTDDDLPFELDRFEVNAMQQLRDLEPRLRAMGISPQRGRQENDEDLF